MPIRFPNPVPRLLDLLYPASCLACGGVTERSALRHLCGVCLTRLDRIHPPYCQQCGNPFFGQTGSGRVCAKCHELEPVFLTGRSVVRLTGPGRLLVHQLKYDDGRWLADDFRTLLAEAYALEDFLRASVLVPVPLHPRRERTRGFNQSAWLAARVAEVYPRTTVEPWLARVIDTPTQTHLSRTQREANVKKAFLLAADKLHHPTRIFTLVDDVMTTGATLNACARVLKRAGAQRLQVLTFAHG